MRSGVKYNVFSAQAATGYGSAINVKDYRTCVVSVATSGNANFTLKVQGSIQGDDLGAEVKPDFTAAQSVTNAWSYVQCIDYDDGSAKNGATGITTAGTDIIKLYEVNTNGLEWLCLQVSAYAAGAITAKVLLVDNL